MKRAMYLLLLAVFLLCVSGCSRKEKGNDSKLGAKIVSEDFQRGNGSIMKTEKGYYYYDNLGKAIRYYDIATGKDMYLCNKPECRHDGNAFCVATNEKYMMNRLWLYSDRIFAAVVEETDTQYLYKVLTIALDGSEMSEFATYMTLEKTGQLPWFSYDGKLVIHRNKAMLPMTLVGKESLEDTYYYGTAILDLDTKEVSYLDEEPLSKENLEVQGMSAYGEHIYYYKKEGRRNVLHRYNVTDGTDESYTLQPGFEGDYVVLDEDNIVYIRSNRSMLSLYHPSTGLTEQVKTVTRPSISLPWYEGIFPDIAYKISAIRTDGTYIYICGEKWMTVHSNPNGPEKTEEIWVPFQVLNYDFEEVATVNLTEVIPIPPENISDLWGWNYKNVVSLGDDLYFSLVEETEKIYRCKRSGFLDGNTEPEFLYEIPRYTLNYY